MASSKSKSTDQGGDNGRRRPVRLVVTAGAVAALLGAGSQLGIWDGKDYANLTFEQSLEVIESMDESTERRRIATYRLRKWLRRGVTLLKSMQENTDLPEADRTEARKQLAKLRDEIDR